MLCGGEDAQHAVAQQRASETRALMAVVNGQAAEHHDWDGPGRHASASARGRVGVGD